MKYCHFIWTVIVSYFVFSITPSGLTMKIMHTLFSVHTVSCFLTVMLWPTNFKLVFNMKCSIWNFTGFIAINTLKSGIEGGRYQYKQTRPCFVEGRAYIRNLFLLLVGNNMAVEEWNKLQYWFDALIVATKNNKFKSEATTVWLFFSSYMGVVNIFFLVYLLLFWSWDIFVLICFISYIMWDKNALLYIPKNLSPVGDVSNWEYESPKPCHYLLRRFQNEISV